jgi:D-beta-D-heptose 7-phosphate kinase/D-beta-D-heptose 1-phosphate adenosyltransferase
LSDALCVSVIRAARAAGVPILADPKTPDFGKYSGATTVCPNLGELSLATGVSAHKTEKIMAAGRALIAEHDLQFLTVTMSERGITVIRRDSSYHSPARARCRSRSMS